MNKILLEDLIQNTLPLKNTTWIGFGYGSSIFKQSNTETDQKMIDFIVAVPNTLDFHKENLQQNKNHYSGLKYLGPSLIAKIQSSSAKIYFNPLIKPSYKPQTFIKYGITDVDSLLDDLIDWRSFYLAGRLQKPVKILGSRKNNLVHEALDKNLLSALSLSFLLEQNNVTEEQLYRRICGLSYVGDIRMKFAEDQNKVKNIVENNFEHFHKLYIPRIRYLELCGIIKRENNFFSKELPQKLWDNLPQSFQQDQHTAQLETRLRSLNRKFSAQQTLKGFLQVGYRNLSHMGLERSQGDSSFENIPGRKI